MSKEGLIKIDETKFAELVARRWKVSLTLTVIMLAAYFGFIIVLAFDKELLAIPIGEHMTIGIPIGIILILFSCVMTGIYVRWANGYYDRAVHDILKGMRR